MVPRSASVLAILIGSVALFLGSKVLSGQSTSGPDVIVGDLHQVESYGSDGSGIYAYSVGTVSCNVGDEDLLWFETTPEHPVISQNLYRYSNGRFEQIGQSWLKHGFAALTGNLCSTCTPSPLGTSALGVGCSDPYGAILTGRQGGLGPKSEVVASTGTFPYPPSNPPVDPVIGRRLQALASDVDPTQNPGALYFVESQYITADDAAASNDLNNASYRPVTVADDAEYSLALTGQTVRELPALFAWQAIDPEVTIEIADVPGEGRFYVAYRVTQVDTESWRYEYAILNYNSDRAVGAYSLDVDDTVTIASAGTRHVRTHSGEPYSNLPWSISQSSGSLRFSTDDFAANPFANALRWGTLANFYFEANSGPTPSLATLELFTPGAPAQLTVPVLTPSPVAGVLPGPSDLVCSELFSEVTLSWNNPQTYDEVEIRRDGVLIDTIAGTASDYVDSAVPLGLYLYDVRGVVAGNPSGTVFCSIDVVGLEPPTMLSCVDSPSGVTLNWSNPQPYNALIVERDGQALATLSGDATTYFDSGAPTGERLYSIRPESAGVTGSASDCQVIVLGNLITGAVLVFAPTGVLGAPQITNAVEAANFTVTTTPDLNGLDLTPYDAVFVVLGVSPNNAVLTPTEGQSLANYLELGGRIYIEGADTFAFDTITPLHEIDGIFGADDGLSDLFDLEGLDSTFGLDLSRFGIVDYAGQNNFIDDLLAEPGSGPIWKNALSGDFSGVFKPASTAGPLIGCSFQFFGLPAGEQNSVMAHYLAGLGFNLSGDPEFERGQINDDNLVNIADVITLLEYLFVSGPAPLCLAAADLNDDGAVDVTDAIRLLGFLFQGQFPPNAPAGSCGSDPTPDTLPCSPSPSCP